MLQWTGNYVETAAMCSGLSAENAPSLQAVHCNKYQKWYRLKQLKKNATTLELQQESMLGVHTYMRAVLHNVPSYNTDDVVDIKARNFIIDSISNDICYR